MASPATPRDPVRDHLPTPQNAALPVIDCRPIQVSSVASTTSRAGYEVYPVIDAVGGTSPEAHELGGKRMIQAGARPMSSAQLICELQPDWQRKATTKSFAEIPFSVEGH